MPQAIEDPNKKGSIIDQIFEGLKLITDKELLDIVHAQRAVLENEIREENRNSDKNSIDAADRANLSEMLNNARG